MPLGSKRDLGCCVHICHVCAARIERCAGLGVLVTNTGEEVSLPLFELAVLEILRVLGFIELHSGGLLPGPLSLGLVWGKDLDAVSGGEPGDAGGIGLVRLRQPQLPGWLANSGHEVVEAAG